MSRRSANAKHKPGDAACPTTISPANGWLRNRPLKNRNPSDIFDLIDYYTQARTEQLETTIDAAAAARKIWQATGLEAQQTALMKIGNALIAGIMDVPETSS